MRTSFSCTLAFFSTLLFCGQRLLKYIFLNVALLLLSACGSETASKNGADRGAKNEPVEIIPYTVNVRPESVEVQAVGTARAEQAAVIRADDGGEVTAVYFQAGDLVSKGDVLLALELDEESLAVDQARVAVKDAEQLIARFAGSKLPGAISDTRIDEVKIAAEAARIELSLAELALDRRQVRAPFSGIVGLTNIDAGARITAETEITRLDDRSVLYVDFQAPEQVYGRIVSGDKIDIEPFSSAGTIYSAKVHKIDSRIDEVSRSFTVRAEIDNGDDKLRPGMSFKIKLQLPGQAYPVVPEAAIIWGGDGAYVWLVEDGKAQRVSVTIVSRDKGQVLVRAPISEGSIVVAEGVQKVREGTSLAFSELYSELNSELYTSPEPPMPEPSSIPALEIQKAEPYVDPLLKADTTADTIIDTGAKPNQPTEASPSEAL